MSYDEEMNKGDDRVIKQEPLKVRYRMDIEINVKNPLQTKNQSLEVKGLDAGWVHIWDILSTTSIGD